jgi:hypothetical protein
VRRKVERRDKGGGKLLASWSMSNEDETFVEIARLRMTYGDISGWKTRLTANGMSQAIAEEIDETVCDRYGWCERVGSFELGGP